ncbi:uncharacterized protein LOC119675673 [Teleopsis dalmanni]|uniref:uncharacterized protein LOC119675673 n=1 Tax=Teleopsis dalmanni TaxID=139649 RepID=UPI0018CD12BD|nr:uncharacterized protein LOC119675673 [Teleopsis dalmanni]
MPCLQEFPENITMATNNGISTPSSDNTEHKDQDSTQPIREITQTDRLNNRLLKSFLEHVNAGHINSYKLSNCIESDNSNDFSQ